MASMDDSAVCSLLLVRNSVDHDARVLRAARVAARSLGGKVLIVGVGSATAAPGTTVVEGVPVLRLPARAPALTSLIDSLERLRKRVPGMQTSQLQRNPHAASTPHPSTNGTGCARVDGDTSRATAPRSTDLTAIGRARRVLGGLSFFWQAISVARHTRPKLVQANDWNTMWTGMAIKLCWGARLVYDSHELWPDRNGRWEQRRWLLACEALFVRFADEVITSSPGYADALSVRYRVRRPLVVRNIPESEPRLVSSSKKPPSPARVFYIGGLMPGRGLEQMIDALALTPHIGLCAIGPGAWRYRASLLARADTLGVADRVELCEAVAPGEVRSVLAGASVGLCLIQPICRSYELCLPNKLFEYAAAGIPVLSSDMPVLAATVRKGGLGEVVAATDPRAIAAGLERLLQPDRWRQAAQHARAFADTHSWAGEASTLTGVYGRAIGERAA